MVKPNKIETVSVRKGEPPDPGMMGSLWKQGGEDSYYSDQESEVESNSLAKKTLNLGAWGKKKKSSDLLKDASFYLADTLGKENEHA